MNIQERSGLPTLPHGFKGLMVAACAVLASCAADGEPLGVTAAPVLNGTEDATDTAVIAVDTFLPTGEELCSGYLIMPDLVLTARHCAAPVENPAGPCVTKGTNLMASGGAPLDPTKLGVYGETTLGATSKKHVVAEVTVLPGSTGQSLCGNDLALLRLAAPFEGVTPLALAITSPPNVGDVFTAIGYGVPAPNANTVTKRLSRGGLLVSSVGAGVRTTDGEWIADTGPCAGDSGSPAVDQNGAAIGVMSRGPKATCVSMIYQRLDVHADFLVEQAKASALRLGVPVPAWAGGPSGAGGAGGTGGAGGASAGGGAPSKATPADSTGCNASATNAPAPSTPAALALLAMGLLAVGRKARPRAARRWHEPI